MSPVELVLILSNTILVAGGIGGNILVSETKVIVNLTILTVKVCLAVATTRSLRTVVNVFLVNLAVADMMVLSFCAPFSILQVFMLG